MKSKFTSNIADRLDRVVVAADASLTRSAAQRLIELGRVWVNGALANRTRHAINIGDVIEVNIPPAASAIPQAQAIPLDVIYEDADVIVINKPAGIAVHPGAGNADGTLVNAALAHAPELAEVGDEDRPGIVHRLDKETSGVMLIAKTARALNALQAQFKAREVHKTYLALCIGDVQPTRAIINKPIARDTRNRQRMTISSAGRESVTEYEVVRASDRYALVRAQPRTGRTHQIRVHLASIGYPVVGDAIYGGARVARDPLSQRLTPRHLLHAQRIEFHLPSNGALVTFEAPLPSDFEQALADVRV